MSQDTLACRRKCVRIEESADAGIIISGLEVIEFGLLVVYVATVAQGVDHAEGISKHSGGAQNVAIRVIFVAHNNCARSVHDGHYVTLEIGDVIVGSTVVLQRIGLSAGGVEEVEGIASISLPEEFTAGVHVGMLHAVDGFTCTDTVGIIGVAYVGRSVAGGCKLSAIRPRGRLYLSGNPP